MNKINIYFSNEKYISELEEILNMKFKIKKPKPELINPNSNFHIKDLPEFEPDLNLSYYSTTILYNDINIFNNIFDKKITPKTKYVYYPHKRINDKLNKVYKCDDIIQPKYPIYIVSKGRYEKRPTVKLLESFNIDYKIIVEKKEYKEYLKVIDKEKILVIPNKYFKRKGVGGSIPARMFSWEHSLKNGFEKYWCLDDNIMDFKRLNHSYRYPMRTGIFFNIMEKFSDRFTNIGLTGCYENKLIPAIYHNKRKIYVDNTRCFSCILINTKLLMENNIKNWRGIYNEDLDLSLRILKKGLTNICFTQFLIDKPTTGSMKGGNTCSIYRKEIDGLQKKLDYILKIHPDVIQPTFKFGKPHFKVDYKSFKNTKLILKDSNDINEIQNNWNMYILDENLVVNIGNDLLKMYNKDDDNLEDFINWELSFINIGHYYYQPILEYCFNNLNNK